MFRSVVLQILAKAIICILTVLFIQEQMFF